MNQTREQDLLQGAIQMDPETLVAIYDTYNHALYIYAARLLGDQTLAEDCVSETFSRMLKALRAGQGPRNHLQAYLYRVAHNWITDHFRRHPQPLQELSEDIQSDPGLAPAARTEQKQVEESVRTALAKLTPEQRQVLVLRYYEGWDLEEISASMNKAVGAVKALQHRAMETMKKLLLPESSPDGWLD